MRRRERKGRVGRSIPAPAGQIRGARREAERGANGTTPRVKRVTAFQPRPKNRFAAEKNSAD